MSYLLRLRIDGAGGLHQSANHQQNESILDHLAIVWNCRHCHRPNYLKLTQYELLRDVRGFLPGGAPIRVGLADGSTFVNGWTNQGTGQIYESSGQDVILAADGSYYVSVGHSGATGGTFTQSFDTTVGATYLVDYLLSLQQGVGTVSMQLEALDGVTQLVSVTTTIDQIAGISGTQLQFTAT